MIRIRTCLFPPCDASQKLVKSVLSFSNDPVSCNLDPCKIDDFKPNLSNDPENRPCVFPFMRNGILHETCFQEEENEGTSNFYKCSTTFNYDQDHFSGICPNYLSGLWSNWKVENSCSQNCGGGYIFEVRRCYMPPCENAKDRFYERIDDHVIDYEIGGFEFESSGEARVACGIWFGWCFHVA